VTGNAPWLEAGNADDGNLNPANLADFFGYLDRLTATDGAAAACKTWRGVLGASVIDRAANLLYAVNWTNDRRVPRASGGTGKRCLPDLWPGANGFVHRREQRSGLLLSNETALRGLWRRQSRRSGGMALIYGAAALAMKTIWSPTPNGRNDRPSEKSAGFDYAIPSVFSPGKFLLCRCRMSPDVL
jgi:hypothetical protein